MAATKPLTHEEIANTEKKLDMPLDDIIKMTKNTTSKPKKQQRFPNKNQRVFSNSAQNKAFKVRRYLDSRPFVRQGVLAQRRSNFQGNQFPLTAEVARKAAAVPLHNRPYARDAITNSNRSRFGNNQMGPTRRGLNGSNSTKPLPQPKRQQQQQQGQQEAEGGVKQKTQTLDSLFAHMKEQRVKAMSRPTNALKRNRPGMKPIVPWARGRLGS